MHANLKKYLFYYWFAFPALPLGERLFFLEEPRTVKEALGENWWGWMKDLYYERRRKSGGGCFCIVEAGVE